MPDNWHPVHNPLVFHCAPWYSPPQGRRCEVWHASPGTFVGQRGAFLVLYITVIRTRACRCTNERRRMNETGGAQAHCAEGGRAECLTQVEASKTRQTTSLTRGRGKEITERPKWREIIRPSRLHSALSTATLSHCYECYKLMQPTPRIPVPKMTKPAGFSNGTWFCRGQCEVLLLLCDPWKGCLVQQAV